MRLTIIPVDKQVYINGVSYNQLDLTGCGIPNDVHALQWYESNGEIEFTDKRENQSILELPTWANACVQVWNDRDYIIKNPPAPTPEQIIKSNEMQAKNLLQDSDWSVLPDVNLSNKVEWENYRTALRQIATNPTVDVIWPTKRQAIWN